eukprot:1275023-Heterocapsa_arctica.AAC.1
MLSFHVTLHCTSVRWENPHKKSLLSHSATLQDAYHPSDQLHPWPLMCKPYHRSSAQFLCAMQAGS